MNQSKNINKNTNLLQTKSMKKKHVRKCSETQKNETPITKWILKLMKQTKKCEIFQIHWYSI